MRSKGSPFTLGAWGWRLCSLEVGFMTATVRNHWREDRMALPMVTSARAVMFGCFQRLVASCRVASFRVAGVALGGT